MIANRQRFRRSLPADDFGVLPLDLRAIARREAAARR